eukprot:TRINITY_DN214_c0_g1_i3.p1 TRINITY_DN214_c0_g1~~TRINITY_DN214_c0_g1_i3.p1  ORF type:complete len:455 (-),score=63.77 TRINITY_DN214_c0_g1_i3:309-1673(-)
MWRRRRMVLKLSPIIFFGFTFLNSCFMLLSFKLESDFDNMYPSVYWQLGLAEKNIVGKNLIHDLDILVSDPSESNTNSTTFFSDDTDDKFIKSHTGPEISTLATPSECKAKDYPGLELSLKRPSDVTSEALESPLQGNISCPRKSKLKVGEASAFLTYVKTGNQTNKKPKIDGMDEDCSAKLQNIPQMQNAAFPEVLTDSLKGTSPSFEKTNSATSIEVICNGNYGEGFRDKPNSICHTPLKEQSSTTKEVQNMNGPGVSPLTPQHFVPTMMNHSLMSSSVQICHGIPGEVARHFSQGMIQFHAVQPCGGVPVNSTVSCYPFNFHVATGQLASSHGWTPVTNMSVPKPKLNQIQRREAALNKFRQKRKDRCFDKKIRYVSRKRLAEQRPRLRGQFVRQTNGAEAIGNDLIDGADDSEEEDDEDEHGSSEVGPDSSPESIARILNAGTRYPSGNI